MQVYKFSFTGRQSGAIGIVYKINKHYEADNLDHALSFLYEDYDIIRGLTIESKNKKIDYPKKINFIPVRSNRERKRDKNGSYI